MPPPQILVGVVGKTNVGKSTFFAAATLISVPIENRPFVTIEPNVGIGYVRSKCVHKELGLKNCNPRNSLCIQGERFIPIKLMDVAGLIRGAHKGRGLGNKFLDNLRQADVLLHIVDAAGSTDEEGRPVKPGYRDPMDDIIEIEHEIDEWMFSIISKDWPRLARTLDHLDYSHMIETLAQRLSGLSIRRQHVIYALKSTKLESSKPSTWREEELRAFIVELRKISKPIVIVANKADIPEAEDNIKRLMNKLPGRVIIPVSSLAELLLRRAANRGLIRYLPGDSDFEIINESKLTPAQRKALNIVKSLLKKWSSTGVQQALNAAVFNVLEMIVVYPVEDPNKFTDSKGFILPDAYLIKKGTTARELAYMVHTELGKGFLYAINAKTKQRVGENYILQHNDVIKVVSTIK
ncbi:MAG: redox-regulated ATPase YchF [Thermoprotei archaeon]|nr:MAG: redox-regulated ATPase YchF [Thermoprotei archaeon]